MQCACSLRLAPPARSLRPRPQRQPPSPTMSLTMLRNSVTEGGPGHANSSLDSAEPARAWHPGLRYGFQVRGGLLAARAAVLPEGALGVAPGRLGAGMSRRLA